MFPHDYTGVEESGSFAPAPPGDYTLRVIDTNEGETRNGDPMVSVTLEIAEGRYVGKKVWHNVSFLPKESPGAGISMHFLHCLAQPYRGQVTINPLAWRGRQFRARLEIDSYESTRGTRQKNIIAEAYAPEEATPPTGDKLTARETKEALEDIPF